MFAAGGQEFRNSILHATSPCLHQVCALLCIMIKDFAYMVYLCVAAEQQLHQIQTIVASDESLKQLGFEVNSETLREVSLRFNR